MDVTTDWFWEGNVVETLSRFLGHHDWEIKSKANTFTKEQGVDIIATRNGTELFVEAKGYPSKQYRDPRRSAEQKRTNPTLQAKHWFSHALLKAVQLQNEHPAAVVAMAFPDFPRYRNLYDETRLGLDKLGLVLLLIQEHGTVVHLGSGADPIA